MKTYALPTALILLNLFLLVFLLARLQPAVGEITPEGVVRCRGLQVVDGEGRVRASIRIYPADPKVKLPDGRTLPETTLLRLIDPNGRPSVKLSASEQGGLLSLGGETDKSYTQVMGNGVRLTGNGREKLIQP